MAQAFTRSEPFFFEFPIVNIIFEQPLWYILPALLLGLAYALLLYYRNSRQPFSKKLRFALAVFRFTLVSILAMLLLHPYLKQQLKHLEQPVIILAHDNSASLVMGPDSTLLKQHLQERYDSLLASLAKDYQVDTYTFDGRIQNNAKPDFHGQQTDISLVFNEINKVYYNRNVGALVLLTDGISNKGIPPDLIPQQNNFPVIAVGLGDTVIRPDIRITELRHNKIVLKGTEFPVEISMKAQKAIGKTMLVSLMLNGEKVGESKIQITNDPFTTTKTFQIGATEPGRSKLSIQITGLEDELILENNQRDSYIEILDKQLEVLLLARSPHPDIAAIRAALGEQHKIKVEYIANWKPQNENTGILILHDLPAFNTDNQSLETFLNTNVSLPLWVIIGSNTDINALNRLQTTIQFSSQGSGAIDLIPISEPNFTLFSLEGPQLERINRFPALHGPMLETNLPLNHVSLMYQRIRTVGTNYPLFGFASDQNRRLAYTTGTGLWRWRMADFNSNGNHETFNQIVSKTIHYQMVKNDNRRLRLIADASYLINDEIKLRAELYNPALERVNDPDVLLEIQNIETDANYEYLFSRTQDAYQLNIGRLPSGNYLYRAETVLGSEKLQFEGEFVVDPTSIETQENVADHQMLRRIVDQRGGQFLRGNEWKKILNLLDEDERIASTASYTSNYNPLISLFWLPLILIVLVTFEWLLRKINGSY